MRQGERVKELVLSTTCCIHTFQVAGSTLYNMIQLNDVPTNKEDRPIDPIPKIIKTEVLSNPFDDIAARVDKRKLEKTKETPKSQSKATK